MRITFDINTDEFERELARADRELSIAVRDGVKEACEQGAAEARATHVYKDRTGDLTKSIEGKLLVSTPGAALGEIRAKKYYASYVENGTAAHEIYPKTITTGGKGGRFGRAMLRFVIGGRVIFASKVNHPGTKPHPFMGQAYQKAERVLVKNVEMGVDRARKILEQ